MSQRVNLWCVYKQAKQRTQRNHSDITKALAWRAAAAAKAILASPTLKSVQIFRMIELEWAKQPDVRANSVVLANRFYNAIRTDNFEINIPHIRNANLGYNPAYGQVYCLTSSDKPGLVKIGATTMHIHKRMVKLKCRHGYSDLYLVFQTFVQEPFVIESMVHKSLKPWRDNNGEEWFAVRPGTVMAEIKAQAHRLNLRIDEFDPVAYFKSDK